MKYNFAFSGENLKLGGRCVFAEYLPRFDFYGNTECSVKTNIGKEMDKTIGRALRPTK